MARRAFQRVSASFLSFTRDTGDIKICAFIGLMYMHDFAGMNNDDVTRLHDAIMGPPPFGATVP